MPPKRATQQDNSSGSGNDTTPPEQTISTATRNPNPGPMPGFTSEQATSLQAMIAASVSQAVTATVKTAINDAVNQAMAAFEARNTPLDHQIQAPRHARFARMTPAELKAHEAFCLLSWDEQMASLQAWQAARQAARLAVQKKKKHRNEKTRLQYKRKKQATQQATPPTPKQATQPATQPKQETEKSAEKATIASYDSSSSFHGYTSFRLPFLTKQPCHYMVLASLPGYMEYAKDMEATGQG